MKTPTPAVAASAIAFVVLAAFAAAGEPSDWYQDLVWHRSDPAVMADGTPPSGTVTVTGRSIAVIIGRVSGNGTVNVDGQHRQIKLSGLSFFDIGAATFDATGEIYNLTAIQDITGHYAALTAGAAIARGGSIAYLRNEHGVVIRLRSSAAGLRFNVSMGRVTITLAAM